MNTNYSKIISVSAALAFTCAISYAQTSLISPTLNNGDFESSTGKIQFATPTTSSTSVTPYWGFIAGSVGQDSGVQVGGNVVQQGLAGSFEKPGQGAFNLVSGYTIATGNLFTLTFWVVDTGGAGGDTATATLYKQAPGGSPYGYFPSSFLAQLTTAPLPLYAGASSFVQYTLTYTAVAGDAGNNIGVSIFNNNTLNHWISSDNFNLTVQSVPEPSTYALLFAGIGGLWSMRRFRRTSV